VKTLRQKTLKMTMRYTHTINRQQVAAQGQFLEAIKLANEALNQRSGWMSG